MAVNAKCEFQLRMWAGWMALTANCNRDPKSKAFTEQDFVPSLPKPKPAAAPVEKRSIDILLLLTQ